MAAAHSVAAGCTATAPSHRRLICKFYTKLQSKQNSPFNKASPLFIAKKLPDWAKTIQPSSHVAMAARGLLIEGSARLILSYIYAYRSSSALTYI